MLNDDSIYGAKELHCPLRIQNKGENRVLPVSQYFNLSDWIWQTMEQPNQQKQLQLHKKKELWGQVPASLSASCYSNVFTTVKKQQYHLQPLGVRKLTVAYLASRGDNVLMLC